MSGSDGSLALYRCNCPLAGPPAAGEGEPLAHGIDLHCHILVPEVEQALAGKPDYAAIQGAAMAQMSAPTQAHNGWMFGQWLPRLLNLETRLGDMDAMGIEVQVLSPSPTQYHYWTDVETAEAIVDLQNDRLAALCAQAPSRFRAFGAIALHHPQLAVRQLETLMARGFKGVEISTRIAERELSDPALDPFWKLAAESGAVVFIHPLGTSLGQRVADHYLSNIIGQPLETTIALSHLIFSGVLDRHPALKILAAHGGGYLPGYFGRSDHAHAVRPDSQGCAARPSSYLQRIWYDTVVHDPAILDQIVHVAGVSQIVLGTDYPFDMGEYRQAALLDAASTLDAAGRAAIVSGNARRLLNL